MTKTGYKYQLEKGSKKHICPNCRKKTFVKYLDNETGDYLPERYGRCDRQDHCGYHLNPYKDGYNKNDNSKDWTVAPKKRCFYNIQNYISTFIPENIFRETLTDYCRNSFIQNLLNNVPYPFDLNDIEKIISLYYLGTIETAITFPFIDGDGNIRAIQVKGFDGSNHTTKTDWFHSIMERKYIQNNEPLPGWLTSYKKNEKIITVPFGTHLLNRYRNNPVFIVEAPKSAIYGALYYGHPEYSQDTPLWLAIGSLSYLNYERCKVLAGREVYLFPDLSKDGKSFELWRSKASELQRQIRGTRFAVSDLIENIGTDQERDGGNDIADFLIEMDWREFRRTPKATVSDVPGWFVDMQGILRQYQAGEITGDQFLEMQDENMRQSGLTVHEYVEQIKQFENK